LEYAPIEGVKVIGIGYKARNGKDTAAQILQKAFGPVVVQRFGFADDLYAVCRIVHGMRAKDAKLLQDVGETERQRDPQVWIRSVYSKLLDARPRVAVITDMRHINEANFVRALGGEVWQVRRVMPDGSQFIDPSRPAGHVTERALDGYAFDRTIENPDGNPEEFRLRLLCAYMAMAEVEEAAA
jgi:hypothetical protein